MTGELDDDKDLAGRVKLIEDMLAEGRRRTGRWGWVFVLWGVAYYVAIAWATWGQGLSVWGKDQAAHWYAWPVTMISTSLLTMVIGMRMGRANPATTVIRAIVSVWTCTGISMLVLFPAMSIAGTMANQHTFVAIIAAMMGANNGVSGLILKLKMQIASAAVWWITSALACFGSDAQLAIVFLSAIFLCQIVFGTYLMILESRTRRESGLAHA
jgi:hypothetical protein